MACRSAKKVLRVPTAWRAFCQRVHLVIGLLKRWMPGTHQGAIGPEHLDDDLNEFTFRFNRRRSASRGKLFCRLAQHAVKLNRFHLPN